MENTEANELLEKGIGTIEHETLKPATVKIASIDFQILNKKNEKMASPLAKFMVIHPDKDEPIMISKVKFLDGEKIKLVGLWCNLDKDGNFSKSSAISKVMSFLKVESLKDCIGKTIDTLEQTDSDHYLCLKAY